MRVVGVFRNADVVKDVPAGALIFDEGDQADEMFGVIEGEVEIQVHREAVRKLGPDDTFGEMALVDHSTRSARAVATTDCKLAVINERTFLFLVHETPMFALQVMSTMAERLRSLSDPARLQRPS